MKSCREIVILIRSTSFSFDTVFSRGNEFFEQLVQFRFLLPFYRESHSFDKIFSIMNTCSFL